MTNKKCATLSPVTYARPSHPGILLIPNNSTHVTSYKLKLVYDENIWFFHKLRGFEQALIHQVVTAVNDQYILSVKNRTTGQFTGNIRHIFSFLLSRFLKISPSHLNNFEKEVTEMHYDPVNPFDKISQKVEDLLEYGYMSRCIYSHLQEISKACNILNKTGNYDGLSSPGIVFLQSRKRGLRSKHIFANPIKNSLRPDNWTLNNPATGKKILLNTS